MASRRRPFRERRFTPKPVNLGDELEVDVSEMSRRGDGLVRVQGFVIFIPGAKLREHIKIKIVKVGDRYAVAELVK